MPITTLNTTDAAELAELLQFLTDWLTNDHDRLHTSLTTFITNNAYGINDLPNDLNRFTFLLGGNGGEALFQPDPH